MRIIWKTEKKSHMYKRLNILEFVTLERRLIRRKMIKVYNIMNGREKGKLRASCDMKYHKVNGTFNENEQYQIQN